MKLIELGLSIILAGFFFIFGYGRCHAQGDEMPMGFFTPKVETAETVIYLYTEKDLNTKKPGYPPKPVDSLTFKKFGYNIVLDYSPSWFSPVIEKLDYQIFYISVKKLGERFVEIIANEETGKTIYMEHYAGEYVSWQEFLLGMHSVEFKSENQKLYDHPKIKSAGRPYSSGTFFRPLYIQGDWMQVDIIDENFNNTGNTGWIRWRKDNNLLIGYNLLS